MKFTSADGPLLLELRSAYGDYYGRFFRKGEGERAKSELRAWFATRGVEKGRDLDDAGKRECIEWMKGQQA